MPWTLDELRAALDALPQPMADIQAAADTLNAQTVPAGYQDAALGGIQGILLISGDWLKIEARAGSAPSNPPAPTDAAIPVAKAAVALVNGKATVVSADHAPAFAAFVADLVAVGDVSSGSQAAIAALAQPSPNVSRWDPPVTAGAIQTAMRG